MNDGDKALVIQEETIIDVAERNMQGIVPLYYEMSKAEAQELNSKNIYDSLIMAYKANIGEISNNITKIWNSDDVDINAIKWFCMENNFQIDFAKTLFMPERPEYVDQVLSKYVKNKVPHFFIYAKDKDKKRVEKVNDSSVNKLERLIPNKRINFIKIAGEFDYKLLMRDPRTKIDLDIVKEYIKYDRNKDIMMKQYDNSNGSNAKLYIYKLIRDSLLTINSDIVHVTDTLTKYLYTEKKSKYKTTLWESFGDVLLHNLTHNKNGTKPCEDCGDAIKREKAKKYCSECSNVRERLRKR